MDGDFTVAITRLITAAQMAAKIISFHRGITGCLCKRKHNDTTLLLAIYISKMQVLGA